MADKNEIPEDDDSDLDTEAALAFLTDEERALLSADGSVAEDDEEESVSAGEDEEDAGDTQDATADDVTDGDHAVDDGAPAGEEPKESAEEEQVADGVAQPRSAPLLQPVDITSAQTRIKEIPSERDVIEDRFDAGEIDAKQRRAELARLDDEMLEARLKVERASLAAEMAQQQEVSRWQQSVREFAQDHPVVQKNELTWSAFDQAVRAVTGDRANAGLSDRGILEKAFSSFADAFGIAGKPGKEGAAASPKSIKTVPKRDIPPTLAKVPAAAVTDAGDNRWANLDRLADRDPIAYEAALARMSDADRDAYLAS